MNASRLPGRHAHGYALVDEQLRDVTVLNPSGMWGAGNLVSSATDIAHFWRALLGGKLLTPTQLDAMKTTVPAWRGTKIRYGLGIFATPAHCGTLWGHGGSLAGYSNNFQNSADGRRQAAVIANQNPGADALGEARGNALRAAITNAHRSGEPC